jgi:hypothetical protein
LPQIVERAVERSPSVLVVLIGPEKRENLISPQEPARVCNSEIGKECEPLGLREDGAKRATVGTSQIEYAQHPQTDHGDPPVHLRGLTHPVGDRGVLEEMLGVD